jgi:predicted nucleic acid-binding Zn ribbon protein
VVFSRWEAIVGSSVAAHAQPLSLRDGVLRVAVDEPGWATQLRFLAPTVLARFADAVGPDLVTSIEVSVRA